MQLDPLPVHDPPHIMAGGQAIGAQLAREGDEVDELHALVARRARHRRASLGIFIDEPLDHPAAEAAFIVEHIMGDAEPVGDLLRIINVLPGATGARTAHRLAMIVELERHADHFGAGLRGEPGRDRAVDAARHGDNNAGLPKRPMKVKADGH